MTPLPPPPFTYDACIIGGGLAGSALAIHLARAGWRTVVVERDEFPRDKLCGEFLSPESQRLLASLGCAEALRRLGAVPITQARFTASNGAECRVSLPGVALGVRRLALDDLLFRQAQRMGAITLSRHEAIAATGRAVTLRNVSTQALHALDAAWIIGAHGRRGKLDRELARSFFFVSQPYIGLKRHHLPTGAAKARLDNELRSVVEIHLVEGGYCGLNFVETGAVNICMLLTQHLIDRAGDAKWETVTEWLRRANPALAARLEALEPCGPTLAVAQVPFRPKEAARDPVLFVGDAAGVIAPLCGDGQAMALESAALLADLLITCPPDDGASKRWSRLATAWQRCFVRHFATRLRIGRFLQAVLLQNWIANPVLAWLAANPLVSRWLTAATRGS